MDRGCLALTADSRYCIASYGQALTKHMSLRPGSSYGKAWCDGGVRDDACLEICLP